MAKQQLLTMDIITKIPPLYCQDGDKDPVVYVKYFTPWSNWTWFATEGQEEDGDFLFFGYVIGLEKEWGYFYLSDLMSIKGPMGLAIERDEHFPPRPISQIPEIGRYQYPSE